MSINSVANADTQAANKRLKTLLRGKHMTQQELAVALGMSRGTVAMTACGAQLNRPFRRRAEKYLRARIWSTEAEWEKANLAEAILGMDPIITRLRDVQERAIELGFVPPESRASISYIIECAAAIAEGNPLPSAPTMPTAASNADLLVQFEEKLGPAGLEELHRSAQQICAMGRKLATAIRARIPRTRTCPSLAEPLALSLAKAESRKNNPKNQK